MAVLSPICNDQQVDVNGAPLSGGTIETYLAGTSTPAPTFTDSSGAVPQTNPIVLNVLGLAPEPIWLATGVTYKFIVKAPNGVVQRTIDNIVGVSSSVPTQDQWVRYPGVVTYISATSFSVTGDQVNIFQVGRRVYTVNTGGVVYSSVLGAVFSAGVTTVTLVNDSGVLDAGLSDVYYALLSSIGPSVPAQYAVNSYVNFTGVATHSTSGTPPAFVLTVPAAPQFPAFVLTVGMRFRVHFHQDGIGGGNTLNINGSGAKSIVAIGATGLWYLPNINSNYLYDLQYNGTEFVVLNYPGLNQAGEYFWWALNTPPSYALVCNGAAVSRTTYARLFSIIGTYFGPGDGSTTFNLPGLASDFTLVQSDGSNAGSSTTGQVISHSHGIDLNVNTQVDRAGAQTGRFANQPAGAGNTALTGGPNNLAAGARATLCIRF